jgi:hypothetical protein
MIFSRLVPMNIAIVGASALLQLLAALLALRLIRITGGRTAWIMIAVAILIQMIRRFIVLFRLLFGDAYYTDTFDDLVALAISLFMASGLAFISPLFLAIKRSEEVLRLAHAKAVEEQAAREKLINELQEALANIRTLKGLIPICSSCKKVRDDKGYWQQVEVYVRDHSEAEFTHGICPDCFRKLYPTYKLHEEDTSTP